MKQVSFFQLIKSFIYPTKVQVCSSTISGSLEVVFSNGKHMLDTTHVNYSFGGLHLVFQRAFEVFKIKEREINNALILGFGTGSVASILENEYKKEVAITAVEKDEKVIELARKYFSIDSYKNLTVHGKDAADYILSATINSTTTPKFDLIVVDVFVDLLVPASCMEEEFVKGLNAAFGKRNFVF